jgi:hypothetical protein
MKTPLLVRVSDSNQDASAKMRVKCVDSCPYADSLFVLDAKNGHQHSNGDI